MFLALSWSGCGSPDPGPSDTAAAQQADTAADTPDAATGADAQADAAADAAADTQTDTQADATPLPSDASALADAAQADTQPNLDAADTAGEVDAVPQADAEIVQVDSAVDTPSDTADLPTDATTLAPACTLGAYGPPLANLKWTAPWDSGVKVAFGPTGQAVILEPMGSKTGQQVTWVGSDGTLGTQVTIGAYGMPEPEAIFDLLAATGDGGALVGGHSSGSGGVLGLVHRLDSSGKVTMSAGSGSPFESYATAVYSAPTGEVALGFQSAVGAKSSYFKVIAANGTQGEAVSYSPKQIAGTLKTLVAWPTGGYVLGGSLADMYQGGHWSWLLRIDAKGTVVWANQVDEVLGYTALAPLADGSLLAGTGTPYAAKVDTGKLRKFSGDGKLLWQTDLLAGKVQVLGIWPDASGCYVGGVADKDWNSSMPKPSARAWLARTDNLGNVQWLREYAGSVSGSIQALSVAPDQLRLGGFLYPSAGGAPANLVRSDVWGHTDCTSAGLCAALPLSACDDGNPCTADDCAGASGCVHKSFANGTPCGSGLVCTGGVCL